MGIFPTFLPFQDPGTGQVLEQPMEAIPIPLVGMRWAVIHPRILLLPMDTLLRHPPSHITGLQDILIPN
jgi:hypothetical protein